MEASKKKRCGLDEALEDIQARRVYNAKDVDDLFEQILGNASHKCCLEEALEEARTGKVSTYNSVDEYFEQIGS